MVIEEQAIVEDYADVNGVWLHYVRAGQGAPIYLLHGFPQSWYQWRHQIRELSRDHEVIAPDLRGFNLSSKPSSLEQYGTWSSARDVASLATRLGHERFLLVGHDWGAGTAWSFALHYPERLHGLVILSTAHPALFDRELRTNPEQQQASQYLLLCRRRGAAKIMGSDNSALLRAQLDFPFIEERDLDVYLEGWCQPQALEGMMRWYRREGLGPPEGSTPARGNYCPEVVPLTIDLPTLVFYGDADPYTRPRCHAGLDEYVPDLVFENLDGGSHWLCEEAPDVINDGIRRLEARLREEGRM